MTLSNVGGINGGGCRGFRRVNVVPCSVFLKGLHNSCVDPAREVAKVVRYPRGPIWPGRSLEERTEDSYYFLPVLPNT